MRRFVSSFCFFEQLIFVRKNILNGLCCRNFSAVSIKISGDKIIRTGEVVTDGVTIHGQSEILLKDKITENGD